jgi:hypothetical protein
MSDNPDKIQFEIDANPMYSWAAWGNMSYKSVADVIAELIDNSKQAGSTAVRIKIFNEDGHRFITIEDNGSWGKITKDILVKCFGYGKSKTAVKQGLNEHNCGLKHSLAYMDPHNIYWQIQIKNEGVTWELKAPYSHMMTLKKNVSYTGEMTCPNSTIIKIPLEDTQFKTLYYSRSVKGILNEQMLTARLGLYLSSFWMRCDDFMQKKFQIILNDVPVEPYDILRDSTVTFGGENGKIPKRKMSLTAGSPEIEVEVWQLNLTSQYRKDHPLFKRNAEQSGVFIFKHGRYIKGPIFSEIYGKSRDYHFAHHVVLVNITGDSSGLPATHTTKNDFNNKDPKLEVLYAYINTVAPAIQGSAKNSEDLKCELEYIRRLVEQKRQNYKRRIDKKEYMIYEQEEFKLYKETTCLQNKEKLDMVEHDKRDNLVTITEGKKDKITPEGLRQLFFYYRNLKYFCPDFQGCDFEVKFITLDDRVTKAYEDELGMLQKHEPEFTPVIETFAQYNIS